MSGHSKWSTIKHKKAIKDQKRGAVFSKCAKDIILAVIEGGRIGEPEKNIRLKLAIERAKYANMPKTNITRAIQKAMGQGQGEIKSVVYEAFACGNIPVLIVGATDNPNRSVSQIKSIVEKMGGKLASMGSVSYMFDKCACFEIKNTVFTDEDIMMLAQEVSAFDIQKDNECYTLYIPFEKLGEVTEIIKKKELNTALEVVYKPNVSFDTSDLILEKLSNFCEALEDLDDVSCVYPAIS